MPSQYEAVRVLTGTAVDLVVIRICQRLYEGGLIILVLRDVMSKASVDFFVVFLARPSNRGWFTVVVRCLTSEKVLYVAHILHLNCTPLSMRKCVELPFFTIKWSKNRYVVCVSVLLD